MVDITPESQHQKNSIQLASRREAPRLYPIGSAWDELPVIVMAYPDFLCIYEG
jgi:hypothetical protein